MFLHSFSPSIRMGGKSINFEDKKINKRNFCKNKKIFKIDDIDVNKILVSKKESYGNNSLDIMDIILTGYNTSLNIMMMMMSLEQYL